MPIKPGHVAARLKSGNLLLNQLSSADLEILFPHMQRVLLPPRTHLLAAADPIRALYFPENGILAIGERLSDRRRVEIAVIGCEGMLGWPALLGCDRHAHDAVVQGEDGRALRLPLEPAIAACRESATLWATLLGFVQSVMNQMVRTIASNVENSMDERIARWLLMRHDRLPGDEVLVRHEEIAEALGIRRASVTDGLHVLEGEQLIRCNRGRIAVRNRRGLEAFAGSAYDAPGEASRRRVPDRGAASRSGLSFDLV